MYDSRHYFDLSDFLEQLVAHPAHRTQSNLAAAVDVSPSTISRTIRRELGVSSQLAVATKVRSHLGKLLSPDEDEFLRLFIEWCLDKTYGQTEEEWPERWHRMREREGEAHLDISIHEQEETYTSLREMHPPYPPPPLTMRFFNYEEKLARAYDGVTECNSPIWIEGLEGIGKTRLLQQLVALLKEATSAGERKSPEIIWLSCDQTAPDEGWYEYVLTAIAQSLPRRALAHTSASVEERKAKGQALLKELEQHATLLILDNYHVVDDPDLDEWLLQVGTPSVVVVSATTHENHASLYERAWQVPLSGLRARDGVELMRYFAVWKNVQTVVQAPDEELLAVVTRMMGHPEALLSVVVEAKTGISPTDAAFYVQPAHIDWERRWNRLSLSGRQVGMVMTFFATSAGRDAISQTVHLSGVPLQRAIAELLDLQFLYVYEAKGSAVPRYQIHALARPFLQEKLQQSPAFEAEARQHWVTYYRGLASRHTVGKPPGQRYWHALSNFRFGMIGMEWPNIEEVLRWADNVGADDIILELMLLLVHYLDKMVLFEKRLIYVRRAADIARISGRMADEGWLRVDGLGWTLMEERRYPDAEKEIRRGIEIAQALSNLTTTETNDTEREIADNLLALGYAFLARAYIRQQQLDQAQEQIQAIRNMQYWPIIQSRVDYVRGLVALALHHTDKAIELLRKSNEASQIMEIGGSHELGYAYLNRGESGDYDQAREVFLQVIEAYAPDITIEVIQCYLGLAHAYERFGNLAEACMYAQKARAALGSMYPGHDLMKDIRRFLEEHCDST
jgi:tetratricopeptide (TPR) repeat protein